MEEVGEFELSTQAKLDKLPVRGRLLYERRG